MNEATYRSAYSRRSGPASAPSPSCRPPGTRGSARWSRSRPRPRRRASGSRSMRVVRLDDTRRSATRRAARKSPRRPTVPLTSRGCTHTPPFAIVAYTDAICSGVTADPLPVGRSSQPGVAPLRQGGTMPCGLTREPDARRAAEPEPVEVRRQRRSARAAGDLGRPDVAGLGDDVAERHGLDRVRRASRGSCTRRPAWGRAPGSARSMRHGSRSIAAAAVMTLLTEPGSNASVTARLRSRPGRSRTARSRSGRTRGRSPSRRCRRSGSITMTVPPLAWFASTASSSAVCTWYWISRSIVVYEVGAGRSAPSALDPLRDRLARRCCSNVRSPGHAREHGVVLARGPASPVAVDAHAPITAGRARPPGSSAWGPRGTRCRAGAGPPRVGPRPHRPAAPRTRTFPSCRRAPAGPPSVARRAASAIWSASPRRSVTSAGLA